jgi:hypothetical protein
LAYILYKGWYCLRDYTLVSKTIGPQRCQKGCCLFFECCVLFICFREFFFFKWIPSNENLRKLNFWKLALFSSLVEFISETVRNWLTYYIIIVPFSKSNTILHHKVNGLCSIFSLDNLNKWIYLWFSQAKTELACKWWMKQSYILKQM